MIISEMLAAGCGLGAALAWGAGDFSGGLATKKNQAISVVFVAQILGGVLLAICALILGEPLPGVKHLLLGAGAGLLGMVGLMALYSGLASGRMGLVAPLSAVTAAALPAIYGGLAEGLPEYLQITGFVVALLAIWLLTREGGRFQVTTREMVLALIAGASFGFYFIVLDMAVEESLLWPLVFGRAAAVVFMLLTCLFRRHLPLPQKSGFIWVILAGTFDTLGNVFFALASQVGRLDIAAVISSLYPAGTVILAFLVLKESISRNQWQGLFAALAALVLIAA